MRNSYSEFSVPDPVLRVVDGVEATFNCLSSVPQTIYARVFTPRIRHSLGELMQYSGGLVETMWDQLPPFSRQSLQLLYLDFLPLLAGYGALWLVDNRYAAYESQLPIVLSYLMASVLAVFRYALLLMAWLYKPQSLVHSSVLLLKLPSEWQKLPKEDAHKLDISCCNACNKLREIKGDVRSIVLYCFQQLILGLIRVFPLGSVISFVPHTLMTGRMLAEYRYRTEGVCDRHIEQTYQQNWEFFAVLGLGHFLGTAASNWFCSALINMPADAVEPCISGLIMLGIVRLTYAMRGFPHPAEKAISHFPIPDPTRWVVESGIDFAAFKLKQNLREPSTAIAMLEKIKRAVVSTTHFFAQLTLWCKNQYQKQAKSQQFFSTLPTNPMRHIVPSILLSTEQFFEDPVVGRWCLDQINSWRNALNTFLEYRQLMITISETLSPLHQVEKWRHHIVVQVPLFFFGGILSSVNNIFTLNFIVSECPNYLRAISGVIPTLCRMQLFSERQSRKALGIIKKLEANLIVLRRILNELPESSREAFFNLIKDDHFSQYISSIVKYLESILAAHAYNFELIDLANIERIDSCIFPEMTSCNLASSSACASAASVGAISPNVGRIPLSSSAVVTTAAAAAAAAAGGVGSMEEWDDSDRRFTEQSPLPKDADSDWDDSDCRLERRMG